MKKTIIIMSGIPGSGKSTWVGKYIMKTPKFVQVISKDHIRGHLFGKLSKYKINSKDEKNVEIEFQKRVNEALIDDYTHTIVLDNTHCREKYLDHYIRTFPLSEGYKLYINFIDCSLTKALFRNVVRKITSGRWIPIKILRIMKRNYDQIDRDKYLPWTPKNRYI